MLTGTTCSSCNVAGCKTCSAVDACTAAKDGYYMVSSTPTVCTVTGCKTCTAGASTCTACIDGYYYDSTATPVCTVCSTGCTKCTAAGSC